MNASLRKAGRQDAHDTDVSLQALNLARATTAVGRWRYDWSGRYQAGHGQERSFTMDSFRAGQITAILEK